MNIKPVNFNLGDYISKAIDLMKKDLGTFILSFICVSLLSIIPFCGFLAIGNFYRICYKIDKGLPTSAGEIFDFDDFMPYLILQVYIFAGFFLIFIPVGLIMLIAGSGEGVVSGLVRGFGMLCFLGAYFVLLYFVLQAFYIPAFITFKKVTDIKKAWKMSKEMTKGNLLTIFLFSIVASFLGQIGILLCIIGIIITMPFYYIAHYFAYKDAFEQIEHDEIKEIGTQNF